jgi:hypothetical protein
MIRIWCKIIFKIDIKQTEGNEGSYFYLYIFEDPIQKSFQKSFYVCIEFKHK